MSLEQVTPAALSLREAARYCGVSVTFFQRHVRPVFHADYDLRAPGSIKPMPRWSRKTLDTYLATRTTLRSA